MLSDNKLSKIAANFMKKCNIKVHSCKSTSSKCKKCYRLKCYICEGVEDCAKCSSSFCHECIAAKKANIVFCDSCNSSICSDCSNDVTCQFCNNSICEYCSHLTKSCSICKNIIIVCNDRVDANGKCSSCP